MNNIDYHHTENGLLDLNPYQIFFFFNKKTLPYKEQLNDYFNQLEAKYAFFKFVPIEFDAEEHVQFYLSDKFNPQLYISVMHADIVCRRLTSLDSYIYFSYAVETFFSGKTYGIGYMKHTLESFVQDIQSQLFYSYTNTIQRYLNKGHEQFSEFLSEVFKNKMDSMLQFAQRMGKYPSSSTSRRNAIGEFVRFFNSLSETQKQELKGIIDEDKGYPDEQDSIELFNKFIHYKYNDESQDYSFSLLGSIRNKSLFSPPKFQIEINQTPPTRLIGKGNYDICLVNDSEKTSLAFKGRDDKMSYMLCLLCNKTIGGLAMRHFKDPKSAKVIAAIYNKLYRKGGEAYVEKMKADSHNLSQAFANAKTAYKGLDEKTAYWCSVDMKDREDGNISFNYRKPRISQRLIVVNDPSLLELAAQIAPLDQLSQYRNIMSEELREAFNRSSYGRRLRDKE